MTIRRGYSDTSFGQMHWRMLSPPTADLTQPDLYCLHPAPFSSLAFTGIMPHLAHDRRAIAIDYPGYGGSDALPDNGEPAIEDFAKAMFAAITNLSTDLSAHKPIDVMGFHTGCLVGAQMCLDQPQNIRRAVFIDVPAFAKEMRPSLLENNAKPPVLTPLLDCLANAWASGVTRRLESQPMARAFEMFVEQLRPGERMNAAFHAAFSYPWEERLPKIKSHVTIVATQSPLLTASRAAAGAIIHAQLIERLDITRAVLDEAAEKTADVVDQVLRAS
jgi:pimeloyl-ACP methyl ester carboxylesterase